MTSHYFHLTIFEYTGLVTIVLHLQKSNLHLQHFVAIQEVNISPPPLILHWTIYIHVILKSRYIRLYLTEIRVYMPYIKPNCPTELQVSGIQNFIFCEPLYIVASIAFNIAEQLGNLYVQSSLRPICLNEEYIESLWQHRDPEVHAVVIGNWSFIESVLKEVSLSLS